MARQTDFMARLELPAEAPATLAEVRIDVAYTPGAVDRGVPERVAGGLEWSLRDVEPLFQAGFAAASAQDPALPDLRLSVEARPDGRLRLLARNAGHRPMLAYLLVKLVEVTSATPAGAYDVLLEAMDGDEEAAREAFNPLTIEDIARVEVTLEGTGQPLPLRYDHPPLPETLVALAAEIDADSPRQVFAIARDGQLSEPVDNGFLVLQNAGVFQPPYAETLTDPEPEVFLSGPREVTVDGWQDDGFALAELLWLIAGGEAAGIVKLHDAG